ncbi:transglutaminase-like domain-containing protein [Tianweitania sediminis]|uniref:Transglutaminase family protein n=1 Tax=Tianweitania sediminis TaxID=1502156 RepID=A0A8J7UHB3_9HYPH|nr:transglutaminase family protein [Tianweitania sediminis]MBP0437613.1 transglutaminase family protein [Tianweitania sediminis]
MLIRIGYELGIQCPMPTPIISALEVRPERRVDLVREHRPQLTPDTPSTLYPDQLGNLCRRFTAPAGDLTLRYDAVIADSGDYELVNPLIREVPIAELPDDVMVYMLGSRYCDTDLMMDAAWNLFGQVEPGWQRVQAICDYVHDRISFGYSYARSTRTAGQAYDERVGVCRDFAHLAITLCRCMNIPARYVNGYLGDIGVPRDPAPMDFSAWFEAYLEGGWYTFDARHNIPRMGRVVVAYGRDATDVPLIHTFGPHRLTTFKVWTDELAPEEARAILADSSMHVPELEAA